MKKAVCLFVFLVFFWVLANPTSAATCSVGTVTAGSGAIIEAKGLNDVDHLIRVNNNQFPDTISTHVCGRPQNGELTLTSSPLKTPGSYTAYVAPKRFGPCRISSATIPTNFVAQCSFTVTGSPPSPPGTTEGPDPCWDTVNQQVIPACVGCLDGNPTTEDHNRPNLATKSWTALGCLDADPRLFVIWILGRAIGLGGGIAFLLMIFGGFQVLTSAGNPERLNSGKEIIGSALTGLLLIIFSLFILELIGVDILGLENVGFKFGNP